MSHFVPRTCTEIGEDGAPIEPERASDDSTDWFRLLGGDDSPGESEFPVRSLERYRESDAYVLLGAPGAGKTTAFKQEVDCGGGRYVAARDFITLGDRPEWHDTTLFIDGLDEMRAGAADGRTPLDAIRAKLDRIGRPRFRLSCREADWFGANDREHLKSVSRGGEVKVLRLDPLSEDGVRELLAHQDGIEDTDGFIATARERGIDGLLANPQSLLMLVQAVAGGSWPETRKETFELACKGLVDEHNDEHRLAEWSRAPSESELLDAAGRLCAVQLLTGSAGYVLFGDGSSSEYLGLQQISGGNQATLRHVLGTKLFESPGENHVAPVHRQLAEFLAGRYLSQLINNGLPVRRVLALMTGGDGGIVSELRGLAAWLAAHSKTSRREVIDRDPLGTVLYGDARDFSPEEKRRVLECVERETKKNPWLSNVIRMDSRLGALVTTDMGDVFLEILSNPGRDDTRQQFVFTVLRSLAHGQVISTVSGVLMEVVRDDSWLPIVRHQALDAFIGRHGQDVGIEGLRALLADVHAGSVSDPDDELLGILLKALYPKALSAPDLLKYLKIPKDSSLYGEYVSFWIRYLPENSSHVQLAEVLDTTADRFGQLRPVLSGIGPHVSDPDRLTFFNRGKLLVRLLARCLETSQEDVCARRLFRWLRIEKDERWQYSKEGERIRSWLISHPEVYKKLLTESAGHCIGSSDFSECMYDHVSWIELHSGALPMDIQYWYLEQAASATDHDAAEYFIKRVADFVHKGRCDAGALHQYLTPAIVDERLAVRTHPLDQFTERLRALEEGAATFQEKRSKHREQASIRERKEQSAHRSAFKSQEAALKENRCFPILLHRLAQHYFSRMEIEDPRKRLRNVFGRDADLIEAILDGLRGSVSRSDVPGVKEILHLRKRNQTHLLALPFLAGLEELVRSMPTDGAFADENRLRQALAFYYTGNDLPRPNWYDGVLKSHAELAAETLVQSIRAAMSAAARSHLPSLFGVFSLRDCRKIARLASIPLLEAFPVRCSILQLRTFGYLAGNALEYCDAAHLLKVVDKKLAYRSLSVGQRVCWLATGLLASNSTDFVSSYREALKQYLIGKERRVQYLAMFLEAVESDSPATIVAFPDVSTLQLLIQFLGASRGPAFFSSNAHGFTSLLIRNLIDRLASTPSPDAAEAIKALVEDGALPSWRPYLIDAGYRHNTVRREAEFRHPDVDQVLGTLDKGRPSNAADLAALTFEILTEIARYIRNGDTDNWRQYWNLTQDRHPQPDRPLHEEDCRDRLLSDLQPWMQQLGIDAAPEGRYADEKRSDIRISHGGFNVPVEIKKNDHRKLWSAVRNQLIAKYTRDPGTDGHGIYLVFWFGKEHCQPPESGSRPSSAAELEKRLCDTLSPEETRMIGICVIDVSIPPDERKREG